MSRPDRHSPEPVLEMSGERNLILGRGGPHLDRLRRGLLAFRSRGGLRPDLALLIEALPLSPPGSVLTGRDPQGVLAMAARVLWPLAPIRDHHLDAYVGREAARSLEANGIPKVEVAVAPDLPPGPFELVVLPFPAKSESLLGREFLEQAHDALAPGGRLLAGTDSSHLWLQKVVKEIFGRADLPLLVRGRGAVVMARRQRPQRGQRDHAHAVTLRRAGRELRLWTRPGVFSYGRLDAGTRALLSSFEALPGERVLDLGCGSGALGLAAAAEAGADGVVLVDSNARAVALAERNARENGLSGVTVCLRADLERLPGAPFDLVLANPPYFSQGRIAESFVRAAAAVMAPPGRFLMVARNPAFHRPILQACFGNVEVSEVAGYGILRASRLHRGREGHRRRGG